MDFNNHVPNLENMIREILLEKLEQYGSGEIRAKEHGVIAVSLPKVTITEENRMDTGGSASDQVYTKDLFSLEESPRLGCGLMEMKETTFDWTLNYDEIDYVIEGTLTIIIQGKPVTAKAGEIIFIPKGSAIQFSVKDYARFLYVTYPADWATV